MSQGFAPWKKQFPPEVDKALEDNGFDSFDILLSATEEDLASLNLKRGHLVALRSAIKKLSPGSEPSNFPPYEGQNQATTNSSMLLQPTITGCSTFKSQHLHPDSQAQQPQWTQVEVFRFIILGKTGSGKSTTGNTILGQELFDSSLSLKSATAACTLRSAERNGHKIDILDSPGLFDTDRSQQDISEVIVKAVACMHPGPHAILFVVKIGRFTDEEFNVYKTLKTLFDENVVQYMILLFTGGDELERKNKTLEDLLRDSPKNLNDVLGEIDHRRLAFNNYALNPQKQVNDLLAMVREMLRRNRGQPYQCPKYNAIGKGLEEEVNKRLGKIRQQDLNRIEELNAEKKKLEENKHLETKQKEEAFKKMEEEFKRLKDKMENDYKEEMLRKKGDIANNKDPGFLKSAVGWIASWFS